MLAAAVLSEALGYCVLAVIVLLSWKSAFAVAVAVAEDCHSCNGRICCYLFLYFLRFQSSVLRLPTSPAILARLCRIAGMDDDLE